MPDAVKHRSFGSRLEAGPNNIDLLRLFGSLVVLYVHSFVLTGTAEDEPSAKLFLHSTEIGPLVVGMFFAFSGFLVARSAERSPPGRYARARAVRLYPALVALLLLQTFALGPAMSSRGVLPYLADPATWVALGRGLLLSPPLGLPGVFADNPVPLAVNGSLWTLRFEAFFWLVLAIMARCRLLGRGPTLALFALSAAAVLPAADHGLIVLTLVSYTADFAAGVALFAWRDAVPHRAWLAVSAASLLYLSCFTGLTPLVIVLTLPYLVLYLGLARPVLRLPDDVSYGAYLYAFPVQQALVALLGAGIGPWGLTALALPPTFFCAILSRRLVERPAQRRLANARQRAAGQHPPDLARPRSDPV